MHIEEFRKFSQYSSVKLVPSHFTTNLTNRTLLFGNSSGNTHVHVYMYDARIYMIKYVGQKPIEQIVDNIDIYSLNALVALNRLYPECCDYEFCVFLKKRGIILPFAAFNSARLRSTFYGRIKELA